MLGLSAAVYTQTTDCEVEVNGLLTYDREILKIPDRVVEAHKRLYGPLPSVKTLVPSAQTTPTAWSFTTITPPADWREPGFDDRAWSKGKSGFGTRATPGSIVSTEWNTPDIWLLP